MYFIIIIIIIIIMHFMLKDDSVITIMLETWNIQDAILLQCL